MTQAGWSSGLVKVIAGEIRRYRDTRGMSAQQLADACEKLGFPIARSVIANLESGRRETVTVPEVFVIAAALQVPPMDLLLPLGHTDEVEILPDAEVSTTVALDWVSGRRPLPRPIKLWHRSVSSFFYTHSELLDQWRLEQRTARRIREEGGEEWLAQQHERNAGSQREVLWALRKRMRDEGLTLPKLPPELAVLEEVDLP